jgi:hypothetical protein
MGTHRRAAIAAALALTTATIGLAGPARAATGTDTGTRAGVVHSVGTAARTAASTFWTPARMAAAVNGENAAATPADTTPTPPPGIPTATSFSGVPTVGALFFTTGTQSHFCTASVVDSVRKDILLTAGHCVYSKAYATNIAFVPEYHDGLQPYGVWPVSSITVATGWQQSHDPDLDFAFLTVTPPAGTHRPIQQVTGGLKLGIDVGYAHSIEVIGINNTDDAPIGCATKSFEFEPTQIELYCHGFWDGTSGGPWIIHFNPHNGRGTVFGDIGGYEEGGDYEWASYSPTFGLPTLQLFIQAQSQS